jgi:hypothetical protein
MKKILYLLALILLFTSPVLADEMYDVGSTTGSYYDQQRDRWSTWQIRVSVYRDTKSFFDDFTYVSSGRGAMETSGFLIEHGRPGTANQLRLRERRRLVEALEKIRPWMDTATDEQIKATKKLGWFADFRIEMEPDKKEGEVLLRMRIRDVSKKRKLVLYLDKVQVKRLTRLIKKAPEVLDEMAPK